jgi:hypothetical protein
MVNADDEVFLDSRHSASRRFAILEEKNGTAWLYLTAPGKPRPEKDVVVFVRSRLATMDEVLAEARKGRPPPLAKDFATKDAILPKPEVADFSLEWSADGQGVALLRNNSPLAMILADAKRGFSKALSKSGPFGEPWDQSAYERVFGTQ